MSPDVKCFLFPTLLLLLFPPLWMSSSKRVLRGGRLFSQRRRPDLREAQLSFLPSFSVSCCIQVMAGWTVLDVGLIQFSRFPVMILSFSRPVASTCNTPPSSLCKIKTMCRNYQKSAYIDSFLKLQINVKCITCSRNPKVRCQLKPSASQYTSQLFSVQCSFVVHSPVQNGSTQFRSSWYLEARRCSLPDLGGVRRSSSCQFLFISHFVPLLAAYLFQWASATFSCS